MVMEKAEDLRQELFVYLRQIMPGSAIELVEKTLNEVVQGSSGGKLTIGFLIALWSASAGIDSVKIALNAVYKLKETRPYWKRKLGSLVLTLVIALLIAVALGIIFYGSQFLSFILVYAGLPIPSPFFLKVLSFLVVTVVLILTFALLYSYGPNHIPFAWNWITPGAVVAIILWVIFSLAFRLYLHYFDSYAKTYGSLGAIIILMLWLYLTALVILIGGAINAILDEFSQGKYTKESRPSKAENEQTRKKVAGADDDIEDQEVGVNSEEEKDATGDSKGEKDSSTKNKKSSPKSAVLKDSRQTAAASTGKKSFLKIAVGGLFALFVGFFSGKKKGK
jgi:membrane protein